MSTESHSVPRQAGLGTLSLSSNPRNVASLEPLKELKLLPQLLTEDNGIWKNSILMEDKERLPPRKIAKGFLGATYV